MKVEIGQIVLVFDDAAWREHGRDVGDNSIFFRPAQIVEKCGNYDPPAYNIRWLGGDFISRGHFADGFRRQD